MGKGGKRQQQQRKATHKQQPSRTQAKNACLSIKRWLEKGGGNSLFKRPCKRSARCSAPPKKPCLRRRRHEDLRRDCRGLVNTSRPSGIQSSCCNTRKLAIVTTAGNAQAILHLPICGASCKAAVTWRGVCAKRHGCAGRSAREVDTASKDHKKANNGRIRKGGRSDLHFNTAASSSL